MIFNFSPLILRTHARVARARARIKFLLYYILKSNSVKIVQKSVINSVKVII